MISDYLFVKFTSEVRIDGMHYVALDPVRRFSVGHYNEQIFAFAHDFYVVDDELVIEGDRIDRLQRDPVESFSEFDFGDLHWVSSSH